MRQSSFVRNVTFALVLLLLVATIHTTADVVRHPAVQQYIAFVLTHDLDYRSVCWKRCTVHVDWPFLRWPGFVGRIADEVTVTDESGR